MPKVEGYTEQDIFAIAGQFAAETNRVYIAEHLEKLLAEAQNKVLAVLVKREANSIVAQPAKALDDYEWSLLGGWKTKTSDQEDDWDKPAIGHFGE